MPNHKGTIQIETDRLKLRRFRLEDAADMFNNWANDTDVTRYLSWPPHGCIGMTGTVLESWVKAYESLETYNWAMVLKSDYSVIGSISVVDISNKNEKCEIGYCMSKAHWNKGLMTEALKAVIAFLFREAGFNRIQAVHDVNNPASGKVMQKAGMKLEGRLRKYYTNNRGEFVDCDIYSILREEWV